MKQIEIELRNKFISNGIPYDELDKEMISLLDVLNFKLGIKTKYCCYGHTPDERGYVMFDDGVTDEEISKLLIIDNYNIGNSIKIYKWARNVSRTRMIKESFTVEPQMNWIMDIKPLMNHTEERKIKRHRKIINALRDIS